MCYSKLKLVACRLISYVQFLELSVAFPGNKQSYCSSDWSSEIRIMKVKYPHPLQRKSLVDMFNEAFWCTRKKKPFHIIPQIILFKQNFIREIKSKTSHRILFLWIKNWMLIIFILVDIDKNEPFPSAPSFFFFFLLNILIFKEFLIIMIYVTYSLNYLTWGFLCQVLGKLFVFYALQAF